MTLGRIRYPNGAKKVVVSFKIAEGAVASIHKHAYKIVCFGDAAGGRLRADATATTRGKQDPS